MGRSRMTSGRCRWCGCTETHACPGSCSWVAVRATEEAETLCSQCVAIDQAWRQLPKRSLKMRLAFYRGFLVGAADHRRNLSQLTNPYDSDRETSHWWDKGFKAGDAAALRRRAS